MHEYFCQTNRIFHSIQWKNSIKRAYEIFISINVKIIDLSSLIKIVNQTKTINNSKLHSKLKSHFNKLINVKFINPTNAKILINKVNLIKKHSPSFYYFIKYSEWRVCIDSVLGFNARSIVWCFYSSIAGTVDHLQRYVVGFDRSLWNVVPNIFRL